MATVEDSPRHLEERSPNLVPRSPPVQQDRDHGRVRASSRDGPNDHDDAMEVDTRRPRRQGADKYRPAREPRTRSPRGHFRDRGWDHDGDGGRGRERGRDRGRDREQERQQRPPAPPKTEEEKQAIAKAEYEKLLSARSGGTYIPPARLRALQAQITDKSSKEYQRLMWEALKKSINGLINKVNYSNIKHIVPELFGENLIKGRGLFCRSIMKAQAASLPFTPVFAAMAAIVNTKLPAVGELLVRRLILSFRKGFKRSDKAVCVSTTTFLAHLINQQVAHEMLAGQMLLLLLHKPTDDSVEIAVNFMREVGQHLQDMQPAIALAVWDQLRNVLHEADIDKRVQYMVEVLFQVRKDGFKDNPPIKDDLDLVEEEDQITHQVDLDGAIDAQDGLNVFKYDPDWEEHEAAYKKLKAEILGEGSDYDSEDGSSAGDDSDESDEEENEEEKAMEIKDQTNTDLVNLRRTIYLTVMSSIDPEEAVHKLLRVNLPAGREAELPSMIVEICSQEKNFTKFHGLIGERFAKLNRLWTGLFEESFVDYYGKIHRYETNRLRNIAMFFASMLASDAIGWHVLSAIHLNEEETTSSSRIFIKILFQHLAEELGMPKLQARMKDDMIVPSLAGLFPSDNARNMRFSINYFTSIGMGALTEEMRERLQNMPKPALPAPVGGGDDSSDSDSDSVSSYSSYTGSSYSRSRSRSRRRLRSASGSRSRSRSRSMSRSRSFTRSRSPRRAASGRGRSYSRSRSPTPARGARGRSYSRGRSSTRSRSYTRSLSPRRDHTQEPRNDRVGRRRESDVASPPPKRQYYSSESRSPSPPPRRRRNSSSISRSRSARRSPPPPARRAPPRDASYSVSPPPRGRATAGGPRKDDAGGPVPPRRRRNSSSVSSGPRKRPRYKDSRSRSASYDSRDGGRSPSRSRSRGAGPGPSRGRNQDGRDRDLSSVRSGKKVGGRSLSPLPHRRRRQDSYDSRDRRSRSRSLTPPPPRRGRDDDRGAPKRRYSYESRSRSRSGSRSPPTKRGRR